MDTKNNFCHRLRAVFSPKTGILGHSEPLQFFLAISHELPYKFIHKWLSISIIRDYI